MNYKKTNVLWGLFLITAGTLYILQEFYGLPFNIWNFWPLLLIVPSLLNIFKKGINIGNSLALFIGAMFLASSLKFISQDVFDKLLIPVSFIIIGLSFVLSSFLPKKKPKNNKHNENNKHKENNAPIGSESFFAMFSSNKTIYPHQSFDGGHIKSIFGSVILDLKDAVITEDISIECVCAFGGVDIILPDGINAKTSGFPVFGGINNKISNPDVNAPTVFVYSDCVFGGITVKY